MQDFNKLPPLIQFHLAEAALMTGPRAQKPTGRAIRKTVRRMKAGGKLEGGWRSWPAN
jgi:hypothetical protein